MKLGGYRTGGGVWEELGKGDEYDQIILYKTFKLIKIFFKVFHKERTPHLVTGMHVLITIPSN